MNLHTPQVSEADLSTRLRTIDELAAEWGVHRNTIHRLVTRGDLKAVRIASRLRFRPEDVEAYLQRGSP